MIQKTRYFIFGILVCALATLLLNAAQRETPDAVKASPQYYTIRYENDRVRVVEYRLKPGQKEPLHTHKPGVTYIISEAKLRISLPDGKIEEGMLEAGAVHGRETSITHAVENVGDTEVHAIIMELKDR
jgi:quercetin dioxygenase-like cupin family protein